MKKVFALIALVTMFSLGFDNVTFAQDQGGDESTKVTAVDEAPAKAEKASVSISQQIKQYFIDGGPAFMSLVFIVFILGFLK